MYKYLIPLILLSSLTLLVSCGEDEPTNNPPSISDRSFRIPEEIETGERVGFISAFDLENDPLTYAIISGNIDNTFALNSSSGELTIRSNEKIDFQVTSQYTLTVEASDGKSSVSALITINVEEANRVPLINEQTFSLSENASVGLEIGMIIATDPEGDELEYTILGGDVDELFDLDLESGVLTLISTEKLDFETTDSYIITILVEDSEALVSSAPITINILDADEPNLSFELAGNNFTIEDGLIREFGVVSSVSSFHYARTFALADGEYSFSEASGDFVVNGGTVGVFGVLFSNALFSFKPGEFIYADTATTQASDFIGKDFIYSSAIIIDGNNDGSVGVNEEDIVYRVTGGSIKVISNGANPPTLNYNVEVTLYDVATKQFVHTVKADLHFEYSGDYKFSDERARGSGRLETEDINHGIEFNSNK
ncbi:cadherin repeat domain-containing protein [Ekhidna sp.]